MFVDGLIKDYRFILRIFSITLFVAICFAQCYSILRSYLSYPLIINIYDESPSFITSLPGLTICSNNRISLKKLIARNESLQSLFDEKFPGWLQSNGQIKPLVNKSKFNEFRDELARIFEKQHYFHHQQTKNITIDTLFDFRPENWPFIEWFGCARTWKESIDCGNLTLIDSMHNRRCTTLLHKGAMLHDAYNRPELFNNLSHNSDSLNYFDAKEVIKIVINFEPEDYGDLKRQIGARLSFHDNNMVASLGDLDYFVTRGYRYDFSIDRKETKFTKGPPDHCVEYDTLNLDKYKHHVEPRVPLSMITCYQNCVVRNILHDSNCWPPPIPYFRNDTLDPELNHKHCPWFKRSRHSSLFYELMRVDEVRARKGQLINQTRDKTNKTLQSLQFFKTSDLLPGEKPSLFRQIPKRIVRNNMRKYRKTTRFCWSQCPITCRLASYTVTLTKSAWPTDVKILFDTTGKERLRRHCCALIVIKFTHYHTNIHEYKLKYDLTNTIGDLGGLLAFWLGLSIVSIYHAVHELLAFFSRRSFRRIHNLINVRLSCDR